MPTRNLNLQQKALRAHHIVEFMQLAKYPGAVCFSCGNAAAVLRKFTDAAGLDLIELGPKGIAEPRVWWTPDMIRRSWPHYFDATPGHLPVWLMNKIAASLRQNITTAPRRIAAGSGETAVCMAIAFPEKRFTAVYDNRKPATTYHPEAPLNKLVARLCHVVHRGVRRPR